MSLMKKSSKLSLLLLLALGSCLCQVKVKADNAKVATSVPTTLAPVNDIAAAALNDAVNGPQVGQNATTSSGSLGANASSSAGVDPKTGEVAATATAASGAIDTGLPTSLPTTSSPLIVKSSIVSTVAPTVNRKLEAYFEPVCNHLDKLNAKQLFKIQSQLKRFIELTNGKLSLCFAEHYTIEPRLEPISKNQISRICASRNDNKFKHFELCCSKNWESSLDTELDAIQSIRSKYESKSTTDDDEISLKVATISTSHVKNITLADVNATKTTTAPIVNITVASSSTTASPVNVTAVNVGTSAPNNTTSSTQAPSVDPTNAPGSNSSVVVVLPNANVTTTTSKPASNTTSVDVSSGDKKIVVSIETVTTMAPVSVPTSTTTPTTLAAKIVASVSADSAASNPTTTTTTIRPDQGEGGSQDKDEQKKKDENDAKKAIEALKRQRANGHGSAADERMHQIEHDRQMSIDPVGHTIKHKIYEMKKAGAKQ